MQPTIAALNSLGYERSRSYSEFLGLEYHIPGRLAGQRVEHIEIEPTTAGVVDRQCVHNHPALAGQLQDVPAEALLASSGNTMLSEQVDLDYWDRNEAEGRYRGEIRMRMEYQQFVGLEFAWMFVALEDLDADACRTGWRLEKRVNDPSGAYGVVLRRVG